MFKAVFRPNELTPVNEKMVLESPTSYPDLAHLSPVEDLVEEEQIEEYRGPTADDLRREAELFKANWEEEKQRMFDSAKTEAENIIKNAQTAAFEEVKRQTDEAQVLKQQAQEEAERIIADAHVNARGIENEVRETVNAERKQAMESGKEEGKQEGFVEGKAEVDRLIERTQTVLERAQDKRAEILSESEKEIVDLVLLISRKVVKIISENQREVIKHNVIEALRKVKTRGDVLIKVNLADLELATAHKQDFIRQMERARSIQIIEDSSVDKGGCIIETEFGEIDARIASQLAELENKILEISPITTEGKEPPPLSFTDANLKSALSATSTMLNLNRKDNAPPSSNAHGSVPAPASNIDEEPLPADDDVSQGVNAAITASAALAALATMAQKGKRDADRKIAGNLDNFSRGKTDQPIAIPGLNEQGPSAE